MLTVVYTYNGSVSGILFLVVRVHYAYTGGLEVPKMLCVPNTVLCHANYGALKMVHSSIIE